jgi:glycogen phosphorylase
MKRFERLDVTPIRKAREKATSPVERRPAIDPQPEALRQVILNKLAYALGKDVASATAHDWFFATALAVRDHIVDCWAASAQRTDEAGGKRVYYLSIEFLIGRLLFDGLGNLGLIEPVREALSGLDVDLEDLRALEPDAALGNGGLGRLAACFMDSMASIALPAFGYGIRYEFGLFKQIIEDGWQTEAPDRWLDFGNPWEFKRPEIVYPIHFGGTAEVIEAEHAKPGAWHYAETILAMAYDTPIVGWRGKHANTLRLWSALAEEPIELATFNQGDHLGAMAARDTAEAISDVLYPSDDNPAGEELRLRQEFFFTSASLQDLLQRHIAAFGDIASLPDKAAIHLNDTHPALAVAELMRLLLDEHHVPWGEAWRITSQTLNYTNHTLLPEALETWPVALLARLLPRHLQIIYTINYDHLKSLPDGLKAPESVAALSLIEERGERRVRMGHLAFVGSRRINGVSALHTDLLRRTVFHDLDRAYPGRIVNKTNGISFRRWLHEANPALTKLLVETVSPAILDDPSLLRKLEAFADDPAFHAKLRATRLANKEALAKRIGERLDIHLDSQALFDVHIKRIHEYKRQLLNIIEAIALYLEILDKPGFAAVPRVKIFAGKAAASYWHAKLIIKLANAVADVVNKDPRIGDRLKLVFVPNYNVSIAEAIIPAADLSEQISTAGMEASGTGNMKLALNGALTIGTLDGANVEIREHVGPDNIFIFGAVTEEIAQKRKAGFTGAEAKAASPRLARALDAIAAGVFSPDDKGRFKPLLDALLAYDPFMVVADFDAYWDAQRKVDALWNDPAHWWHAATLNIARMGWFTSDRTIREYADEIWRAKTLS